MKKISGIERLVLPFPDTLKYPCLLLLHKHQSIHLLGGSRQCEPGFISSHEGTC